MTRAIENLLTDDPVQIMFEYKLLIDKRPNLNFFQAEGKHFEPDGSGLTLKCGETEIVLKRGEKGNIVGSSIDLPSYMSRLIVGGYKKVIVSTGAPIPIPMMPRETSFAVAETKWANLKTKMNAVKNMIVLGGGAVSTEMAGFANDVKPNAVTLVCRSSNLFSDLPISFQTTCNSQFKKMLGDKFLLERVLVKDYEKDKDFPNFVFFDEPTHVEITNGHEITSTIREVDCIFYGYSMRIDSDPEPLVKHSVTITDDKLNSLECPDITLAGDIANCVDMELSLKMAFISTIQGKVAAEGKPMEKMPGRSIISPFGKDWGASLLALPVFGECCVGVTVTKGLTSYKHRSEDKMMQNYFG